MEAVQFYVTKGEKYDWDRAPSTPCPKLIQDILEFLTQRRIGAEKCSQIASDTAVHKSQMANIGICDNDGNCEQLRFVNNPIGFSPEARAVLDAARQVYRGFYANITHAPWMDWKIETWDVGYYQIRNAMKGLLSLRGVSEFGSSKESPNLQDSKTPSSESNMGFAALCVAHDALRAKLMPQIYSLGFPNPDVEYFR